MKTILLYIFIYFMITFSNVKAETIVSYNNFIINKKYITNLSTTDSTLFSHIITEYTEYGVRLVLAMIPLINTPYRYGGTTISGLDCSAFTKMVYSSVDYELPRTAAEQSKLGEMVINTKELHFGDLLFFGYGNRVSHVGIYLENGYFIHASSSSRKITVQEFSKKYYDRFFVFAKRI